jgi:hypothetical protein
MVVISQQLRFAEPVVQSYKHTHTHTHTHTHIDTYTPPVLSTGWLEARQAVSCRRGCLFSSLMQKHVYVHTMTFKEIYITIYRFHL